MSVTPNGSFPSVDRASSALSAVESDVIVVGAGPAGSATATHLWFRVVG